MRKVINLTKDTDKTMMTMLEEFRDNSEHLPLQRGEEDYYVRYRFKEGVAIIHVEVLPHYYRFTVSQEGGGLLAQKPVIPTFTVGLTLNSNNSHIRYHETPKEKDARDWLNQGIWYSDGQTSKADYLVVIATTCQIIWSQFDFAFDKKIYGDTIEYIPHENFKEFLKEGVKMLVDKHRREHRLDGWDVVNLTHNQLQKLGQTLEEHHIAHDFNNIPLHRYCLALYDKGEFMYYFMEQKGNTVYFDIEDSRTSAHGHCEVSYRRLADGALEMELSEKTNVMQWLTMKTVMPDGEGVMYWQWMMDMFFSINTFILKFGDVTMEVEEKVAQERTMNRQQRRQNKTNSVRLFKSYKLIKNWKSQARKKAEITCPAWGVRGHFRHYRNGKVVFVEAYIKGKERDNYKGKEYNLLPYKDA